MIRIVPRPLHDETRRVLARVAAYDLVVFTSVNGVRVFVDDLEEAGPGTAALRAARASARRPVLAAIGPATAKALEAHGLACDVVPDDYVAEGLLAALERRGVAPTGARVLIPRAAEARDVLPDTLRKRGALVEVLAVYDTLPADELEVPLDHLERADFITFTSSSTVRAFVRLLERAAGAGSRPLAARLSGVALCSIGPITSATLRDYGLPVAVEAREYTSAGLVAAMRRRRRRLIAGPARETPARCESVGVRCDRVPETRRAGSAGPSRHSIRSARQTGLTSVACGPFWPSDTSNSTSWPSARPWTPSASPVTCTNTSLPSSCSMKP